MKTYLNLKLKIFNTTEPQQDVYFCEQAYKLFKKVWTKTFAELNIDNKTNQFNSDDFLFREAIALFDGLFVFNHRS